MVFEVTVKHFVVLYPEQPYYSHFSFSWEVGRVGMAAAQLLGREVGSEEGALEKFVMAVRTWS